MKVQSSGSPTPVNIVRVVAFTGVAWLSALAAVDAAEIRLDTEQQAPPLATGNDVWDAIKMGRIEVDTKTGSYQIVSTPLAQSLLGRRVALTGSAQVQEHGPRPNWFIFLRDMSDCVACDLGDPNKVVKVVGAGVPQSLGRLVTATGRFAVGLDANIGWVYQLQDAELESQ